MILYNVYWHITGSDASYLYRAMTGTATNLHRTMTDTVAFNLYNLCSMMGTAAYNQFMLRQIFDLNASDSTCQTMGVLRASASYLVLKTYSFFVLTETFSFLLGLWGQAEHCKPLSGHISAKY